MKIRTSIVVPDDARRFIASQGFERSTRDKAGGKASRAGIVAWIERAIEGAAASHEPRYPVDPLQRAETAAVVVALRANGWTDRRIKDWLLRNAALLESVGLKLWESPQ